MRIATWNLMRPGLDGDRLPALREQLREIDADMWILTETRDNICPGTNYKVLALKTSP